MAAKLAGVVVLIVALFSTRTHEDPSVYVNAEVRRDATASVVAHGEGLKKHLLVNGIGITELNSVTKVMAHLPLVMREKPPESTCVICFGMGTTFRSLGSWGGRFTAVELVPSVCESFGFFFADAEQVLARPGARVVVDDGRRFLSRTEEKFDLITIDPPPPVEAGGSSLLYSSEFYAVLRERLSDTGVLQQWFPGGEEKIAQAVVNTLKQSFPHLIVCRSFEPPHVGLHLLASHYPLKVPTIEQAIARMPEAAKADMLEWVPGLKLDEAWGYVLAQFVPVEQLLPDDPSVMITDDQPFNEYFLLRRTFGAK
jgi:spermidine synthase